MAEPEPHFSAARRAGDFIFVSGQLPFDAGGRIVDGDIIAQTRQCLRNLESILAAEGAGLRDVVKVMVWLTSPLDFLAFNRCYAEFFPETPPTRATVCSALMVAGARIEIEATAYQPL